MLAKNETQAIFQKFCHSLEKRDTTPLLEIIADDVQWMLDWKGEGIFSGGPLFGLHPCSGTEAVKQLFGKLFEFYQVEKIQAKHYVIQHEEAVILGDSTWRSIDGGKSFNSDWTIRWIIEQGKVIKCRFMVLPENHIKTFIEDEENYQKYTSVEAIQDIIQKYNKLYFDSFLFGKTWSETFWMGHPIFKCPLDLWIYQEIMFKLKPDVVIESGTYHGGSALYLASICDLIGNGKVITIDLTDSYGGQKKTKHERITYLLGSSTSNEIIDEVRKLIPTNSTVLVILDSDHHKDHVLDELRLYHKFVTPGSYLIVEDSHYNGNPVKQNFGPGPREAIEDFLKENSEFKVDREQEKFYMTFNPGGYLLKAKS
ncbi:MAG: CmcI family methyltransferase [Cyanobacteriota bacterium]|nr:CmcI family methyltransferase [Cyanobacteriota bacterium]